MSLLAAVFASMSGTAASVTLDPFYGLSATNIGASASCTITFESDGDITASGDSVFPTDRGDWIAPTSAAPGAYEIRATSALGQATGTFGTWLPLTTGRSWTLTQVIVGVKEDELTIEIRQGSGSVLASTIVSMTAERN